MSQTSCQIMGIVNITPDSFSDGGQFSQSQQAVAHCHQLLEDGADILDLGAESSRPGAQAVSEEDEWQRLQPVLEILKKQQLCQQVSIDSRKPAVIERALDYGVGWVNNIAGLFPEKSLKKIASYGDTKYIAMHMHRNPEIMQQQPLIGDEAVAQVSKFFNLAESSLLAAGFSQQRIFLDPGIGFGKDDAANLKLIQQAPQMAQKHQMLWGVSRKSFLGRFLEIDQPLERDPASKMLELCLAMSGAQVIRTHQVRPLSKMLVCL